MLAKIPTADLYALKFKMEDALRRAVVFSTPGVVFHKEISVRRAEQNHAQIICSSNYVPQSRVCHTLDCEVQCVNCSGAREPVISLQWRARPRTYEFAQLHVALRERAPYLPHRNLR